MKIPDTKSHSNFFQLNANNNNDFATRSNDVFAGLEAAEVKHSDFITSQSSSQSGYQKPDPIIAPERLDSMNKFKRPVNRNFRGKRSHQKVPGFKSDPSKWKKYSLADVSDMSESSNTKAAFSFLNELKAQKPKDQPGTSEDATTADTTKHLVFQKPKSAVLENKTGIICQGSKFRMPEYAIGEKIRKKPTVLRNVDKKEHCNVKDNDLNCRRSFDNCETLDESTSESMESVSEGLQNVVESVAFKKKNKNGKKSFRKREKDD